MLEILGEWYYIDFEKLDELLFLKDEINDNKIIETTTRVVKNEKGQTISEEIEIRETDKAKEINGVRYDVLKNFIEDIATSEDMDDFARESSVGFKLAFNTLLHYKIITKLKY